MERYGMSSPTGGDSGEGLGVRYRMYEILLEQNSGWNIMQIQIPNNPQQILNHLQPISNKFSTIPDNL